MTAFMDLRSAASAENTKNFSGAEIQGLVKSAISFALNRQINMSDLSKQIDETNLKVSGSYISSSFMVQYFMATCQGSLEYGKANL